MKIAIVEDEIRIREGLRHLLSKADSSSVVVGEAENGREGAQLILKERPDLVLADIRMPEMDGIEMLKTVQSHGFSPVVIFLSAYSDFAYAQQAMKLGVSEYLLKPVAADELIASIRRAVEIISRRNATKHGQRTLAEVLTDALESAGTLPDDAASFIETTFGWPTNEPLGVLMLRGSTRQRAIWPELAKGAGLGECETIARGENLLTIWFGFSSREHLAFELEKLVLPRLADESQAPAVAILGFADSFAGLYDVARSIQAHIDYGLIAGEGKLLRYPEITGWEIEMLGYPIELETAARTALVRRDDKAVEARLRDFGRLFTSGKLIPPREIKEAFVRFTWALLSTARELGIEAVGRLSRQTLLERIMSAVSPDELMDILRDLTRLLVSEGPAPAATSMLVRRAESMMKEHFAQGIMLEEIAQKLSVTPEYLGTQIHRELGVTFGTLMKRLRVERAKELFLTTEQKLGEVAMAVGYQDAKYFSRVFKQITGMLPMEFRRLNK